MAIRPRQPQYYICSPHQNAHQYQGSRLAGKLYRHSRHLPEEILLWYCNSEHPKLGHKL